MMKRIPIRVVITAVFLVTLLTFWGLWHIYFQQDEWNGFGKVLYAQDYGYQTLVRLYGSHLTPLTSLFFAFLYNTFGLHAASYAYYSIFLHAINGILVYILSRLMIKDRRVAILAAIVFITARVSSQAVTWYAASASFLPTGFLVLIALILFELFLKHKTWLLFVGCLISILAGLGFRENAIFLFVYFPARAILLSHPQKIRVAFIFGLLGISYAIVRFLPSGLTSQNLTGTPVSFSSILSQTIHVIFFSLPQLLISRTVMIDISHRILQTMPGLLTIFHNPPNVDVFIENKLIHLLFAGMWASVAAALYLFFRLFETTNNKKRLFITLVIFLLLSVLPFNLLPLPLFMESRHFYLSAIGFSLLVGYVVSTLLRHTPKRAQFIVFFLIYILPVAANIALNRQKISNLSLVSVGRRAFTDQVLAMYPVIPSRVLFYGQGDILPHQSGTGYTLMVLLHAKQPYDSYLKNDYLWNLGSQGYTDRAGVGFGYATEFNTLLEIYCTNNLSPENIFSFSWNERTHTLIDASLETRAHLDCPTDGMNL